MDTYVIAVNGRRLRGREGSFQQLEGISPFPFAVEATLAVGPLQVRLDRETLEVVSAAHMTRYEIPKPTGAIVTADTFLDPANAHVSAVWAVDVDERLALDEEGPMAVVHNPLQSSPISRAATGT